MKKRIAVIHSNGRREHTWKCVEQFKQSLSTFEQFSFQEHDLASEFPKLCTGCHSCIINGERTCPHYLQLAPILEDIIMADGVILASPVYVMDVSGSMKNLLDHLAYLWIAHRPRKANFFSVGMAISTGSGGGMKRANQTMLTSFDYLGFRRSYAIGILSRDVDSLKTKQKLHRAASKFYKAMDNKDNLDIKLKQRILFKAMRRKIEQYGDEMLDKRYWKEKGWFEQERPWSD